MIFDNTSEAEEIVKDIIKNDMVIRKMDAEQLVDGKLNLEFFKKNQVTERIRLEKRLFFQKANALNLIPAKKRYIFPYFKKICNFCLACKYSFDIFTRKDIITTTEQ
jgi:superfamily II helicase